MLMFMSIIVKIEARSLILASQDHNKSLLTYYEWYALFDFILCIMYNIANLCMRGGEINMKYHNDEFCPKYKHVALPDENGKCSLCGVKMISLQEDKGVTAQKDLEGILGKLGFTPEDEYEDDYGDRKVIFTKYSNYSLGIRIERSM